MAGGAFFQHLHYWTVIGTNYTKADTETRSRFALTHKGTEEIYGKAIDKGLRDFFILSTCNRTELYGCAPLSVMQELIRESWDADAKELSAYFYSQTGEAAVRHFFRVTAGLDSQIMGDYEIMGQVKKAIQMSRQFHLMGTLTDRISNFAFQASKEIKTKTNLSSGKYSVSFAATELINSELKEKTIERILIVGTGEMGRAMARNMKQYLPGCQLTLTNRTFGHARQLAEELRAQVLPFENFVSRLAHFDAVITTIESDRQLIVLNDIPPGSTGLFLDLSVPQVIDTRIKSVAGVKLFSVDEISTFHNQLMSQRQLEIPKAELILEDFVNRLLEWENAFYYRDVILTYQDRMKRLLEATPGKNNKIEKTLTELIQKIKVDGYHGCSVIQTVNKLISVE